MKKKSNSFEEIYNKVNHNKYSQLTNISGKVEIKSSYKNFISNYKIPIIIVALIFLVLIIYTFRSNPLIILYCIIFILFIFGFAMYSSTYKLQLDEKNLKIYINFQEIKIKTDDLANIYLSREKMHLFCFPIYNYTLNFIYIKDNVPMRISLPTIMVNRKKLLKLFSMIETKMIKDEEEEIKEKEKTGRKVILVTIIVLTVILLGAFIIGAIISTVNK